MKLNVVGCLMMLLVAFVSCDNDKKDPSPGSAEVGTFAGNFVVADDPQTKSGYITDATITVTVNGTAATIKVTGSPSFSRTFTGTVTTAMSGLYDITINKQTAPAEKIAGTRLIVSNNKATLSLDVANDEITVKSAPNSSSTILITGKLQLIGADLLKQ